MLKHLKTLQRVSITIQIIFGELVGSLLKSLNLIFFLKNVKVWLWWCGSITFDVCAWRAVSTPRTHIKRYAAASPQSNFYNLKKN